MHAHTVEHVVTAIEHSAYVHGTWFVRMSTGQYGIYIASIDVNKATTGSRG